MVPFRNLIAFLCLCAIASVFYVTAYKMHTHLTVASVIESVSPLPFIHHQKQTPTAPQTSSSTKSAATIAAPSRKDHEPVAIPDSALVGSPQSESASALAATYTYSFEKLTSNLHSRANIFRSQNNLKGFTYDTALATLAKERSEDMAKQDYFSHTSPDGCNLACRFKKSNYVTLSWGENLAEYSDYESLSESELAALFTDKWIESSEHRKNLLSKDFTNEGIGVAVHGKRIIVTVIFAKS
jgi:uncharacterized protein YkwD